MRSPSAGAPTWHDEPTGLRRVQLARRGPRAPDGPYAVLDVETTGLDPAIDRVVEVAVVRCDGRGRTLSEWSTLVDPGRDPGPTAVHGITPVDLRGAPTFAAVAPQLAAHLDGAVVTAHNLPFDAAFLAAEWARVGTARPPLPGLCTLRLDRALAPGRLGGYSLAACAAAAGVQPQGAHRALADARATAELLAVLLGSVPGPWRPWPRRRLRFA